MLFDAGFTKHSGQEVVTVECYYNAEASRWSGWFIVKLKCGINLSVETFDNAKITRDFASLDKSLQRLYSGITAYNGLLN